ncbi:MAG: hypothetical protein M1481_05325 [Candidatus Thermoplasmatota archaeon]|nr:hypothetical protein [Candidatus Thermoplasmatota archaeon]
MSRTYWRQKDRYTDLPPLLYFIINIYFNTILPNMKMVGPNQFSKKGFSGETKKIADK